ncbi:hypothetical protein D3C81_1782690 [compost metagenome]
MVNTLSIDSFTSKVSRTANISADCSLKALDTERLLRSVTDAGSNKGRPEFLDSRLR